MSSEVIDLTIEIFLPEDIKQNWIPLDGQPVPHLFQFTQYPPQHMLYHDYHDLSQQLHEEAINFQPHTLLKLGPPSLQLSNRYQAAIKAASHPIHSFTLAPISGHPVRLPIWVLDYWREIRHAMKYRDDWKGALIWLKEISRSELIAKTCDQIIVLTWLWGISSSESMTEICDQVMAGLSFFPWNGANCSVHDMVSLLSDSWLSDFHIDYVLTKISHHHCSYYGVETSNRHIFLPVFDIGSVVSAYGGGHHGCAADKSKNLLEAENKIILGQIDSVAGVLHLHNHWTSLAITFKPPRIFYGDSLGNLIPSDKASSFWQWISHMLSWSGHGIQKSDISIYPLEIAIQKDPNSCGLFALNAISHHYLQQNSPLLQSEILSPTYYQVEIALELLQEGAVSLFLYKIYLIKS